MRRLVIAAAAALVLLFDPALASAGVLIEVSTSAQTIKVTVDGEHVYTWPVSTGIHGTPHGTFGQKLHFSPNHRSSLFNNAPMPHSIFYSGNYAIHGTIQEHRLGSRASMGCVRLSRANAATLYKLVHQRRHETVIIIRR